MCGLIHSLLAATVVATAATAAQAPRPDFSGIWVLERADGDLPERAVRQLVGGSAERLTLTMTQDETKLTIVRPGKAGPVVLVFPLDGTETAQRTPHGILTSTTRWSARNALVSSGTRPFPGPFGTKTVSYTEERILSDAGQRLTVTLTVNTPRGTRRRAAVFRRAE